MWSLYDLHSSQTFINLQRKKRNWSRKLWDCVFNSIGIGMACDSIEFMLVGPIKIPSAKINMIFRLYSGILIESIAVEMCENIFKLIPPLGNHSIHFDSIISMQNFAWQYCECWICEDNRHTGENKNTSLRGHVLFNWIKNHWDKWRRCRVLMQNQNDESW